VTAPEPLPPGWTPEALAAYVAERERAANRVAGNVVTTYERPRLMPRIEPATSFDPHKWGRQ
jgi:hypothetical protein